MKDKVRNITTALIIYTLLGVMGVVLLPYASISKENCLKVIKLYCEVVFWILKKICTHHVWMEYSTYQAT